MARRYRAFVQPSTRLPDRARRFAVCPFLFRVPPRSETTERSCQRSPACAIFVAIFAHLDPEESIAAQSVGVPPGAAAQVPANREPPPADERRFDFDLGIGYGQMDGLSSGPPFELHGSVRELPSVSAYATARLTDRFGVYLGVRTGIITPRTPSSTCSPMRARHCSRCRPPRSSSRAARHRRPGGGRHSSHARSGVHASHLQQPELRSLVGVSVQRSRSLDLPGLSWSVGLQFPLS